MARNAEISGISCYAFGCKLTPRDALCFARGEQVTASEGQPAKLSRPLDFLVVADHSDNMGFFPDLFSGKPEVLAQPMGRKWYEMIQNGKGADAAFEIISEFSQGTFPKELMYLPGTRTYKGVWHETIEAAEAYATTGSRMLVRFFGGWDFDQADAETRNPAFAGYTKGVPMDCLRRQAPRVETTRRHPHDAAGAGLHKANLVHPVADWPSRRRWVILSTFGEELSEITRCCAARWIRRRLRSQR